MKKIFFALCLVIPALPALAAVEQETEVSEEQVSLAVRELNELLRDTRDTIPGLQNQPVKVGNQIAAPLGENNSDLALNVEIKDESSLEIEAQ